MKKPLFILFFFFSAFIKNADAQASGVPDTLAYLQSIVANKSKYIGKRFSVVLNSLQIQIKYFSPRESIHYDKYKETSTLFSFYFPKNSEEIYLIYPSLEIYWKPYLNAVQSELLYLQSRLVGWSSAVAAFYENALISEISVFE
jgi:hypothetical protein